MKVYGPTLLLNSVSKVLRVKNGGAIFGALSN